MPLVIPIFIPHEGCPHRCLFCNQHDISGQTRPTDGREVGLAIERWLEQSRSAPDRRVQVALYGGSFTALPEHRQIEMLAAVRPYVDRGLVHDIRLSTRPDCIDEPGLNLLARYGVTIIELGVQSCDETVLRRAGRGHGSAVVAEAAGLIRARGFRLGIQLMLGLPGQRFCSLRATVGQVIDLGPEFVRLYPVLVLRGSGLERLYHSGAFRPLSLARAVAQAAWMKKRFDAEGIGVVRMGLQPTGELERALVTGPYHPAFGELVMARLMLQQTRRRLAGVAAEHPVTLVIAERDRSVFQGQRGANLWRLRQLGLDRRFVLRTDPHQPRQTVLVIAGRRHDLGRV